MQLFKIICICLQETSILVEEVKKAFKEKLEAKEKKEKSYK